MLIFSGYFSEIIGKNNWLVHYYLAFGIAISWMLKQRQRYTTACRAKVKFNFCLNVGIIIHSFHFLIVPVQTLHVNTSSYGRGMFLFYWGGGYQTAKSNVQDACDTMVWM